MERFKSRVAVVTGSSSGIGKEIVKELVKRELIVVGLARNMKNQQELAAEILTNPKTYTGKFHPIQCDLSKEDEITKTFALIRENIGPIAILVNNAGTIRQNQKLTVITNEDFDAIFNVNVKGVHLCIKEALLSMTADQSLVGHIVNVNSVASLPDYRGKCCVPYVASKHAMRSFSRGLRHEILEKKQNVKVSILSPGATDTPMMQQYPRDSEKTDELHSGSLLNSA